MGQKTVRFSDLSGELITRDDTLARIVIHEHPELGDTPVEIEALSMATGKVEWDTRVRTLPLGAATVSNDLVFTTLYNGELLALNRSTGAIVYQRKLPTSTNSPIAVAGNTVLVPAGGPLVSAKGTGGSPQLVAYTVP